MKTKQNQVDKFFSFLNLQFFSELIYLYTSNLHTYIHIKQSYNFK